MGVDSLLLPKELLKSFQDLKDEYLGSFVSTKTIEGEKQNKDPKSTTIDISQKELLTEFLHFFTNYHAHEGKYSMW